MVGLSVFLSSQRLLDGLLTHSIFRIQSEFPRTDYSIKPLAGQERSPAGSFFLSFFLFKQNLQHQLSEGTHERLQKKASSSFKHFPKFENILPRHINTQSESLPGWTLALCREKATEKEMQVVATEPGRPETASCFSFTPSR